RPDQAVLLGDRLPPADCKARSVNCLSSKGIDQLWNWALKKGNIRELTIVTGGQGPLKAFASYMTAGTAQKDGQGQVNVSKSECPIAYREMSDLFKSLNPLKAVPQQLKVNIHHLAWRKQHKSTDGPDYRKVPINLEISHMAEAYHVVGGMEGRAGGTWLPGNKIELSNCETQECNESRKFCRETGDGLADSTLQPPKRNSGEANLNKFFRIGNAPELRGSPKAQSYQATGANLVVATIVTVGMVTRLWDATMGNPPPSP
ncbi:MAG: hypothetical protein L6R35_007386, partial [Caloplaca aegaea]